MIQPASPQQEAREALTESWIEDFALHARAAAAQVSLAEDAASAVRTIETAYPGAVRCTKDAIERIAGLREALADSGTHFEIIEESASLEGPARAALATSLSGGTALLFAHAGVAETGSVVLASDALTSRLAGMLADQCVVILFARAIVRDLDEAGEILAELNRAGHRYISLVTGPSRTADIERVLTIGVQGPKSLHITILTGAHTREANGHE